MRPIIARTLPHDLIQPISPASSARNPTGSACERRAMSSH